jgi:tRNA dimethylallyltransferase
MGRTAAGAVGYRELREAQAGRRDSETVWAEIVNSTLSLVRRQRTYFRRDPRIEWIAWHEDPALRRDAVIERLGLQ